MTQELKKRSGLLACTVLLIAVLVFVGGHAQAASKAAANKKAHKAYKTVISKIADQSLDCSYKYADVTGDGVHEALISTNVGRDFYIYTYRSGKAKCILTGGLYGLNKLTVYKKTGAVTLYGAGHGGEQYAYFKYKSGKYKKAASKSRVAKAGGGISNGPWYYYSAKGSSVKKSAFNKAIKGLAKGKKTTFNTLKWKSV